MACCRQATSHYLNQCWPRSLFTCGYSELTRSCWCSPLVLFTRKYRLHFLDVLNLVLWYTRQIMNKDNHTVPHLDIAKQRDISTLQSLVQGSFVYALSQLEMSLQCNVTQKMMLAAVYNLSGIFLWQTYSARMGISHCQRQVKMISVMKFSLIITYCKYAGMVLPYNTQCSAKVLEKWGQVKKYEDIANFSGVRPDRFQLVISNLWGHGHLQPKWWRTFLIFKVIHKEYSRFLNQFFPTPCSYHELNMIIYTSYINI